MDLMNVMANNKRPDIKQCHGIEQHLVLGIEKV